MKTKLGLLAKLDMITIFDQSELQIPFKGRIWVAYIAVPSGEDNPAHGFPLYMVDVQKLQELLHSEEDVQIFPWLKAVRQPDVFFADVDQFQRVNVDYLYLVGFEPEPFSETDPNAVNSDNSLTSIVNEEAERGVKKIAQIDSVHRNYDFHEQTFIVTPFIKAVEERNEKSENGFHRLMKHLGLK